MKKFTLLLMLAIFLTSCAKMPLPYKRKSLFDITPRLEVESKNVIEIGDFQDNIIFDKKIDFHKLTKHSLVAKPVIAKNIVYSMDNKGYVSAFSLQKKELLWETNITRDDLRKDFYTGGILFSDNKLYITNNSRYLIILDAKDGSKIISKKFSDILRTRAVMANDHILLVQTFSNQLIAYDTNLHRVLWMKQANLAILATKSCMYPVINNANVIAGFSSGEVMYLDVKTGKEKWRYNLLSNDNISIFSHATIVDQPIIREDYVYFVSSNGKVTKIDLDNGGVVWQREFHNPQSIKLINEENLYIVNNVQVAILSAHNGKIIWAGNLLQDNKKQKTKRAILFHTPFFIKENDVSSLNIIASNGKLYKFITDTSGHLPVNPEIIEILDNILYYLPSPPCCKGKSYIIRDNSIGLL